MEKVDLHSHTFRIRDDVGHNIELGSVPNDREAAKLIGQYVIARGTIERRRGRNPMVVTVSSIQLDDDPLHSTGVPSVVPIDAILATAPGPDPRGAVELTDEEFAAFLQAIRS